MLVEVNNAMRVAQEEIFGPVMAIIAYETEEEAIAIANDSVLRAVWLSLDVGRQAWAGYRARDEDRHGQHQWRPAVLGTPFGGFKQSGIGREMGPEGLQLYTEVKSIAVGNAALP